MEKVGVQLVIEGLAAFQSGMGKADSTLKNLIPTSKLLGGAFQWVGGIISGFVGGVARTLEYALGSLISAAIQKVIGWLKELGAEIVASTTEFQKLEVRLNRLNFNDLTKEEQALGNAMEIVTDQTKEQLRWINKLAASTPFDAEDIARTYTLARTYGFTNDEAKQLTYQISEFAAGMGLSNQHIERIIQNFGQMKAAGKITGTEIRDLSRGAFVPVNEILDRVAENLGITTDQLAKLRQSGMTDAEMFFTAFSGMVEDNFIGAAEDMNAILMVATQNVKDMFKAMLSLEVFKGLFEALAVKASGFQSAMFDRWDEVETIFIEIGETLKGILTDIMGLTPSAETMADAVVDALHGISAWFYEHKDDFVNFAKKSAQWIRNTLLPAVKKLWLWLFGKDGQDGAIKKFGDWLKGDFSSAVKTASDWIGNTLIPLLKNDLVPVFKALYPLGLALGGVIKAAFGGEVDQSFSDWINNVLIPAIANLTKWINDNQAILSVLVRVFIMAAVVSTAVAAAIGILITLFGELLAVIVGFLIVGAAGIIAWAVESQAAFVEWAGGVLDTFLMWRTNTIAAIQQWEIDTLASIIMWGFNVISSFGQWAIDTQAKIVAWASDSKLAISGFATDSLASIVLWVASMVIKIAAGLLEILNITKTKWGEIKTEMANRMKAIGNELESKSKGWINHIVTGFEGMAGVVIDALNDLIAEIQSSLSTIFIGVQFSTPGGAPRAATPAGGRRPGTVAANASGSHGWRTVPPGFNNDNYTLGLMSGERYMVIPKGGQMSSAMAGSTVNSSRSVQNTMNLNIVSSAPTESIVADFAMMSSMIGA